MAAALPLYMMSDNPPVEGYEGLGARAVMRLILDLPRDRLLKLQVYEQRHMRRTQVLAAMRRALARLDGSTTVGH
jgi:hypothetical protein